MKRISSISARLFKSYALLIGLFFSVVLLASLIYVGVDVNEKVIVAQETAFDTVVKQADDFFTGMFNFSKTLTNSPEFKEIAVNQLPAADNERAYLGEYFNRLYVIGSKMITKDYRIGVQLKSGKYIWMGSNYFIADVPGGGADCFTVMGLGNVSICKIEENQLMEAAVGNGPYSQNDNQPAISLKRDLTMYSNSYAPAAVLDIQAPYSNFKELMDSIVHSSDMNITVYNGEGEILYGTAQKDIEIKRNGYFVQNETYEKDGKKIQIEPLLNSNVYVVGSIGIRALYRPLVAYLIIVFVLFIVLCVFLLFFTYRLSVNITSPIKVMCRRIKKINFDGNHWIEYDPVYSDIQELNFLSDTVVSMQSNLKVSMNEAIRFRSYEIQSRMLALQAQMQPHFLYNTLMTISAMAEEKEDYEVARVCTHLTRMLRYISSEDAKGVPLSKELRHLRDYVKIMQERFPETEIQFDIPLPMMNLTVPKLVVQPLVENSLKYCDRLDCKIQVVGEVKGNRFQLSISDNGIGFTEDKIEEIMKRCRSLVEERELSTVKIDGMGLANIYARLYLLYGEDMYFKIYGPKQGDWGSRIEIGGIILQQRPENETNQENR